MATGMPALTHKAKRTRKNSDRLMMTSIRPPKRIVDHGSKSSDKLIGLVIPHREVDALGKLSLFTLNVGNNGF